MLFFNGSNYRKLSETKLRLIKLNTDNVFIILIPQVIIHEWLRFVQQKINKNNYPVTPV